MSKRWLLGALAAVSVMAACGGDAGGPAQAAEGGGDTIAVSTVDNEFDPASVTASPSSTIEVTNDGEAPHNFSIKGQDMSVDLEPGESANVMLSELEAGSYEVVCKIHEEAGMTATLEVQ